MFRDPTPEEEAFLEEAEKRMSDIAQQIADRLAGTTFKDYCAYEDAVGDAFRDIDKEFHDKLCMTLAGFPGALMDMWRTLRNKLRLMTEIKFEEDNNGTNAGDPNS